MAKAGKCCEACGQELPWLVHGLQFHADTGIAERGGAHVHIPPLRMMLLEVLIDAYPGTASAARIVDVLYAERRHQPGPTTSKMHASYLRKDLAPLGVGIENVHGYGYRLTFDAPVEARLTRYRSERQAVVQGEML